MVNPSLRVEIFFLVEVAMKKLLLFICMFVLLGGLVWSDGKAEEDKDTAEPIELFLAKPGNFEGPIWDAILEPFRKEYPDVILNHVPINVTDATAVTMDSRIAADMPVHFYSDYFSRTVGYLIPKSRGEKIWALDLSKYWPQEEIDDFLPGILDPYWIDGELLATPEPIMMVAQRINLTLCEKVGYELPPPEDWTIVEFLKMCEAIKKAEIPESYGTLMFAENRSGDWMYMGWLSSFGAKLFEGGDYSKTVINTPAGMKLFTFWKMLQLEGYIPFEAAILNDDHMIYSRVAGLLGAAGGRNGWVEDPAYQQSLVDQGIIDKPYTTAFYPYPKVPGVNKVPVIATYTLHVAFGSEDEEINKIVARFAYHMNSAATQRIWTYGIRPEHMGSRGIPSRLSVPPPFDEGEDMQWWIDAQAIMQENGVLDVGGSLSVYGDIRGSLFPVLQKLYTDKATPQEALDLYEAALNEVLATLEE